MRPTTLPFFIILLFISCRTTEEISSDDSLSSSEVIEVVEVSDKTVTPDSREDRTRESSSYGAEKMMAGEATMIESAAPMATRMSKSRGEGSSTTLPGQPQPEAGQLTAGEWNDLHNWEDWKDLLQNDDYRDMQSHWTIYPSQRYSISVRNQYELPIQDISVQLLDGADQVIWTGRTDNAGQVELWGNITNAKKSAKTYSAKLFLPTGVETIADIIPISKGVNHYTAEQACTNPEEVDIIFVVDATGSMGDEIQYLQKELADVIERSMSVSQDLSLRTGAVFYRDSTDAYVTRTQGFSTDHEATLAFISAQEAAGGGDYPEAVDAALEETLAQDWSETAMARIAFLLLDAPPHHQPETLAKIQDQIAEAAELGIKIIPITASGINRQTEFLMKFMAIATNGTYVFITDHSGIGGPHLDPVVEDYEVEKLNDLMVRLLRNYTKTNGCRSNEQLASTVSLYPNPASKYVTVHTPKPLREMRLLSNSGKLIWSQTDIAKGEQRIELAEVIDGIYSVHCIGEDFEEIKPVIVVNG
ncbi:MAG: VWA domain-containing protein [Bacteroidota bacterium]